MIFLICFLTVLGFGRCLDQLPSRIEIESSINRTIEEVERLIEGDPSLPKLSRSQIVGILENITSQDMKTYQESVEQMRSNYDRALMVVLPYNSKDSAEDLKDLYTKAPMVQLIPDSGTMLPFASIQEEIPSQLSSTSGENHPKHSGNTRNHFGTSFEHKNHRLSYTDVNLNSVPEKFSFDLSNLNHVNSNRSPTKSTTKSNLEVIYSTGVTQEPTKKSTTPTTTDIEPTMPSTKSVVILTSDQWRYNAPPSTTPRTTTRSPQTTTRRSTTTLPPSKTTKASIRNKPFLPTVISEVPIGRPLPPIKKSFPSTSQTPEIIEFDLADMEMMNDAPPAPLYVTPMSSSTTGSSRFVPTVSSKESSATSKPPMREEVATLLASIGLRPQGENTINKDLHDIPKDDIFGENFVVPESNNVIPNVIVGLTATTADSPSISNQNTFESNQDLGKGLSNLSPDVQVLFQRFLLPVSGQEDTTTVKPEPTRPTVTTNSWNSFRPLPNTEVKDEGMRQFLAAFGLGTENRHKKAMEAVRTTAPSVIGAVPNDMKQILENIGLITRSRTLKRTDRQSSTTEDSSKLHIFKPHEALLSDDKQKSRINELLDKVKLVQEGKADVSDVRNIANELVKNTKKLPDGPDPMSLEEILQNYNENLRNEVKRQEAKDNINVPDEATSDSANSGMSSAALSESSSNSTDIAKDTSSSSDSSGNPADLDGRIVASGTTMASPLLSATESINLEGLADSFGGSTAEPDPVLPTPRRSGLYFLVDWNTFLEVGEEDKDKVNLRFAPKAGDKSRFIPVIIP